MKSQQIKYERQLKEAYAEIDRLERKNYKEKRNTGNSDQDDEDIVEVDDDDDE